MQIMKFTPTAFALAALALTRQAFAEIAFGTATFTSGSADGSEFNVAWIYGQDACSWTWISNTGSNPCGTDFTLTNGYTYYLGGCGTSSFAVYNADSHTVNAYATFADGYSTDGCVNQDGHFTVQQQWTFG
ncbi:hypothetical protein LTR36_006054 [Oleoguttula mirabilis]|uniref:Uncharacterized protein n=1 Tax=Oleoguttula mirabilis TaxID=1507867 RepID=A0AAV9JEK1_9PEZI|nr:hypothetical protein LTR36_006054 [Oleoguttula mirabilis]